MFYLNMCDIGLRFSTDELLNRINEIEKKSRIDIIYVGSYFCGNYFISFLTDKLNDYLLLAKKRGIKIRLVLPIFSQVRLSKGKEVIDKTISILGDNLNAIVVNDFGMLQYIQDNYSKKIILGRLLSKDTRDQRVPELNEKIQSPDSIKGLYYYLKKIYINIIEYEVDNIYKQGTFDSDVVVHIPMVYQTVGQVCCYSNIVKDNDVFEANSFCDNECMNNLIVYRNDTYTYVRLGRAVLYEKNYLFDNDVNYLYFPVEELWR